jgi:hypothetical protein
MQNEKNKIRDLKTPKTQENGNYAEESNFCLFFE